MILPRRGVLVESGHMKEIDKENGLKGFETLFEEKKKEEEVKFAILVWMIFGIFKLIAERHKGFLNINYQRFKTDSELF